MTLLLGMSQKVTARHVQRQAMLYVRQSTLLSPSWKIRKVPHDTMPYANERLPWVGRLSGSS